VGFVLGKNQLTVNDDIKNALAFRIQGRFNTETRFELCSQTDRIGFVVSLGTIVYFGIHHLFSLNLLRDELSQSDRVKVKTGHPGIGIEPQIDRST